MAHVTSPSKIAMPAEPCQQFQFRKVALLGQRIIAAVVGDIDRAGALEKDFVGSEPYL
jgi:hypothetical protein